MKAGYPRLFVNIIIQDLCAKVIERLRLEDLNVECMLFPSFPAAERLVASLTALNTGHFVSPCIQFRSRLVGESDGQNDNLIDYKWMNFYAVVYHSDLGPQALSFWRETGDGISSRHAEFVLERLQFLDSLCINSSFCTEATAKSDTRSWRGISPSLPPAATTAGEVASIKSLLSTSIASDIPSQGVVQPRDVFLYQKGLCGIFAVARACVPEGSTAEESQVVIYGWPYAETVKCVERSGYGRVILYGKGTEQDLDDLEGRLAGGQRIQALFCELPSNPQLISPDLHRIRRLADTYGFVVACDDTLGNFVNVDILPYIDVAMTSLTKIFSGASNVMGGSVMMNPLSPFYETVHARLSTLWEDILFPGDISVLAANCRDFAERSMHCSRSALAIATLLSGCSSVAKVNYPPMVPSRNLYERYRRRNGGYGYVLSIIFQGPHQAVAFYNSLDVCKGTSIGANFTLAVPYAQLAHFRELDLAESNGVPRHIVRISVGVEDTEELLDRVRSALVVAEEAKPLNEAMFGQLLAGPQANVQIKRVAHL